MTLVAVIAPNDVPVLVGDLLISGPANAANKRLALPSLTSTVNSTELSDGKYAVSGLTQKLAMISDYLAVGWSGSRIAAKAVIADLRERIQNEPIDADGFRMVLESLKYKEARQSVSRNTQPTGKPLCIVAKRPIQAARFVTLSLP